MGPELVRLALLATAKRIAEQNSQIDQENARIAEQDARLAALQARLSGTTTGPFTPSGMVPVYAKPEKKRPKMVFLAS